VRAAPSVEVVVERFGRWQGMLAGLACAGVCIPGWWLLDRASGVSTLQWCAAVVASLVACVGCFWMRIVNRPFALRWNAAHWAVAFDSRRGKARRSPASCQAGMRPGRRVDEARFVEGDIAVVVDLGAWMLLRFDPLPLQLNLEAAHARTHVKSFFPRLDRRLASRRLWLPLQRVGLEPQWHALRCALYSRASTPLDASRPLNPRQSA
jgi:hypothetical protein